MQLNTCTDYGVESVHDSVVGVGRCGPRVSASRSGGETTAASHSEASLDLEGKKELVGRVRLPKCLYVLNGYGYTSAAGFGDIFSI